jgi:hypothetical protein
VTLLLREMIYLLCYLFADVSTFTLRCDRTLWSLTRANNSENGIPVSVNTHDHVTKVSMHCAEASLRMYKLTYHTWAFRQSSKPPPYCAEPQP